MANRDVSISICGVVVGVMLGAGSVMYAQETTLGTEGDPVVYRDAPDADQYTARKLRDRENQAPTLRDVAGTASRVKAPKKGSTTGTESATPMTECDLVSAVVNELADASLAGIPLQEKNYGEIRTAIKTARDAIIDRHCMESADTDSAPIEASDETTKRAAPAINDCDAYAPGSVRRAKCEGNSEDGNRYYYKYMY
ncbi:MAG: hypothetical protein Q7R81_04740 [Candidatus Peregrinibacteria bacterium]|nr:hypothetical protein [Candidatus Peregrinibacteria bacterium]